MRSMLCVLLIAGCSTKPTDPPPPGDNPLDTIDPSVGFVADAWASTDHALGDAMRTAITDRNRILLVPDPLGVARLATELEIQRTTCKTPPCPIDVAVTNALASYAQKSTEYVPVLDAHHHVLAAWATLAAAHEALGIANVLDQAGVLTPTGRAEIRQAVTDLVPSVGAYDTLDWSTMLAATGGDATITAEITSHAPVIEPSSATEQAAAATVSAVLAEIDRETDPDHTGTIAPLSPLCCSPTINEPLIGSPAYQTLRRLPILREWSAKADSASAIEAYRGALVSLAQKIGSGAASDVTWSTFVAESAGYATEVATLRTTIDAAQIIFAPVFSNRPIETPYDDINASHFIANVATTHTLADYPPVIQLRTTTWIPHVGGRDTFTPSYVDPPATPEPDLAHDGMAQILPTAPVVIAWDVQTVDPLDHLDLRISRYDPTRPANSALILHFIERPTAGTFPTRTVFDPRSADPNPPPPAVPGTTLFVHYVVYAVAVDVHGRVSQGAATEIAFRNDGPAPTDDEVLVAFEHGDAFPPYQVGTLWDSDAPDQITIRSYANGSRFSFRPASITLTSPTASLTVANQDSQAHHLVSVYTAPYTVDPEIGNLAIGGVQPFDLGVVPAGNTVVIPVPAAAIGLTHWTFYDVDAAPTAGVIVEVPP